MIRKPLALLVCAGLFATSAAQGAERPASLAGVNGGVLVGGATGFAPAKPGAALNSGDRIVTRSGQATIRYADGCQATLAANSMTTIGPASPCAGGAGLIQAQSGTSAQLIPGLKAWPTGAYFAGLGTLVIVGAILYGLAGGGDDDEPVSR